MKNAIRKLLSLLLVFVTVFSMIPSASAATCKTTKTIKYAYQAGVKTRIYVESSNKKTVTLNYKSGSGCLALKNGKGGYVAGYVEVRIWGSNDGGKTWSSQLSKTNIKGKTTDTISMKGYTKYKVEFWTWNPRTIGSTRGGNYNWDDICWLSQPNTTVSAKTNNITKISS